MRNKKFSITFQPLPEHSLSVAERHLSALMRQITSQDTVELVHPFAELETFASLVYVAECFGFRYSHVRLAGRPKVLHVRLVRDPEPWAQQRAATNTAAFPQVGAGGPVPGMYLNSLTPVPEAQADVDLIAALIKYDGLTEAGDRKKLLTMAWGGTALYLLLALVTGVYTVLLPLAALTPVALLATLRINTSRRAKLAQRLTAAGCTPVQDEAGQKRYVRPQPYTT